MLKGKSKNNFQRTMSLLTDVTVNLSMKHSEPFFNTKKCTGINFSIICEFTICFLCNPNNERPVQSLNLCNESLKWTNHIQESLVQNGVADVTIFIRSPYLGFSE